MEEKISRVISRLPDFERLKTYESNARHRNLLTPEIAAAIDARAIDLGRELVAKGTDLDLSNLSVPEEKILRAASEYAAIKKRGGTNAGRTIKALRTHGLIEAAERAVIHSHATLGYETLEDQDLGDLSYEQIIIDHPEEFSSRALWYARRRKGLPNESKKPPVKAVTAAQRRTVALLNWLAGRAASLRGMLGEFTNAHAAAAIGMTNMQDQGRAFGNIISRIDFACFRLGLPPLGLTAAEPFRNAWGRGERSWQFPVQSMQRAAKAFTWKRQDFDRVLRQTESFPGLAHFLWKDALAGEEKAVRDWAEGLEAGPRESATSSDTQISLEGGTRNPDWSREEHILGLDLYMRLRGTSYPDEHPEVVRLSRTLQKLARIKGVIGAPTFRNANGVSMKMLNFRRVDQSFNGSGLPSGSRLEEEVWNEFAADREKLTIAVEEILDVLANASLAETEAVDISERYWVLVCNPAKWAIDRFLESGVTRDSWGVRPFDAPSFAAGQLAIVRVGIDRRSAAARDGRPLLEPGIYAICEIEGQSYPGTGASDEFWAAGSARNPDWPTVGLRYLRNYLSKPLSIERLKQERPHLSHLLLDGFQAASFPISASDFAAVTELLGEDPETIAGGDAEEPATVDRLAELESKFMNASPEVKTRVSKGIERGPIGGEVKHLNGYKCQICEALGRNPLGFRKRNGDHYVEAHHVMPVSRKEIGSLSAANIATLCANHHREVHYGDVSASIEAKEFVFVLAGQELRIARPQIRLRIGILAYGSLITDPGDEIKAITVRTIRNVTTPFAVEYARSSGGRGGAPTLVPVTTGGAPVQACIYEVNTDEKTACDILYRREIGEVGSGKTYKPPELGNLKKVGIEKFVGLGNVDVVLSTKLAPTISPLDAATLADLAIASAQSIDDGRDGISYLLNAMTSGINTPLTSEYIAEVVAKVGAADLSDAIAKVRGSTLVVHQSGSLQSPAAEQWADEVSLRPASD